MTRIVERRADQVRAGDVLAETGFDGEIRRRVVVRHGGEDDAGQVCLWFADGAVTPMNADAVLDVEDRPDPEEVALGVWQSLPDAELQAMKPSQFYEAISEFGLDDEDAEGAWWAFSERRARVFG